MFLTNRILLTAHLGRHVDMFCSIWLTDDWHLIISLMCSAFQHLLTPWVFHDWSEWPIPLITKLFPCPSYILLCLWSLTNWSKSWVLNNRTLCTVEALHYGGDMNACTLWSVRSVCYGRLFGLGWSTLYRPGLGIVSCLIIDLSHHFYPHI